MPENAKSPTWWAVFLLLNADLCQQKLNKNLQIIIDKSTKIIYNWYIFVKGGSQCQESERFILLDLY